MSLSQYKKIEILRMEARGLNFEQIAHQMKCHPTTVSRLVSKYQDHQTIDRLKGQGRKKKTCQRTDRYIKLSVDRDKNMTTKQLKSDLQHADINISMTTARRRLHEHGYHGRLKRKVPLISKNNRIKRYAYSKEYRICHPDYWKNVMFVDEKKFSLIMRPRKRYVWRKKNTANNPCNTQPYTRSASVMVWGSFGAGGVGDLCFITTRLNGQGYRDIVKEHLKSSAKKIGLRKGWMLIQDNDPKHNSKIVQSELDRLRIKRIKHPPQSPDMNPIENLWDYVERRIGVKDRTSIEKFKKAIIRVWNNIPHEICSSYACSMTDRINELYSQKGYNTRY